jgi:hypothetical protein
LVAGAERRWCCILYFWCAPQDESELSFFFVFEGLERLDIIGKGHLRAATICTRTADNMQGKEPFHTHQMMLRSKN